MISGASLALFLFFVVAVAVGWFLGFRQGHRRWRHIEARRIRDYLQAIARDTDNREAASLNAVASTLAFNAENFEAHLSLGALFRRRGELGKATELHEKLRHLPGISREQADNADFELGCDFFAAGMLDRAEIQFQGLVDSQSPFAQQSLRKLARIYELESDWHSALIVAERLSVMEPSVTAAAAHYCCELAEKSVAAGETAAARRLLRRALDFDAKNLRARIGLVELEIAAGQVDAAIDNLREVLQSEPASAPIVRDVLAAWLARLPVPDGGPVPTPEALLAVAMPERDPPPASGRYLCGQCGYQAHTVLWCCPGCHGWGTLRPLDRIIDRQR